MSANSKLTGSEECSKMGRAKKRHERAQRNERFANRKEKYTKDGQVGRTDEISSITKPTSKAAERCRCRRMNGDLIKIPQKRIGAILSIDDLRRAAARELGVPGEATSLEAHTGQTGEFTLVVLPLRLTEMIVRGDIMRRGQIAARCRICEDMIEHNDLAECTVCGAIGAALCARCLWKHEGEEKCYLCWRQDRKVARHRSEWPLRFQVLEQAYDKVYEIMGGYIGLGIRYLGLAAQTIEEVD